VVPTAWLEALGVERSVRQTFETLVVHTPHGAARFPLPWSFATFDYPELCSLLDGQNDADFETAAVSGRAPVGPEGEIAVATDRGEVSAPLVVDALGWRRVLGGAGYQPPDAPLSRAIEVHPAGRSEELEVWIDRSVVPAGYGWSFPAGDEVRIGVGSFDPGFHVKEPTIALAEALDRDPVLYQGNWIPHRLRDATEDGVFFAGDSAGQCLPLTAEGIRTAFYFGIGLGRELRKVLEGRSTRERAASEYSDFCAQNKRQFAGLLFSQRLIPRVPPRLLLLALRGVATRPVTRWAFGRYLRVAPPEFVAEAPFEPAHAEPALAVSASS
jgi:hypothetical protein